MATSPIHSSPAQEKTLGHFEAVNGFEDLQSDAENLAALLNVTAEWAHERCAHTAAALKAIETLTDALTAKAAHYAGEFQGARIAQRGGTVTEFPAKG